METLWKPLEELNAYGGARECIERGRMPVQISGCIDGQKSHLISGLAQSKKWTVIVAANERKARELLADYVLGRFSKEEEPVVREALEKAAKACSEIITEDVTSAMNKYNNK